jgi:hypothetical protein
MRQNNILESMWEQRYSLHRGQEAGRKKKREKSERE